jgi:6-pyruvoyltetrahydropterin/6-carboxytetrahydropterin synthase
MKKKKPLYSVALKRYFTAHHFLIGGSWGEENELHSHDYLAEVRVEGSKLDENNYLLDLVKLEAYVDKLIARFQDRTLNALPEFGGENPSIELLAKIVCQAITKRLKDNNLSGIIVKVSQGEHASAEYRQEF